MASTSNSINNLEESSSLSNHLWPAYRNYFTYLKDDGKNFRVKCKLCQPREIILSTAKSSSANLKRHLERRHFYAKCELNECLALTIPKKRSSESTETEVADCKRARISTALEFGDQSHPLAQGDLDKIVTEFIVAGNHPLSTVEEEKFCKILNAGFPNLRVITKANLMNNIMMGSDQIKADVKSSLKAQTVQHVALSVDCWSFNNRSYVGIVAHWLDKKLKRHSSAIALPSVKGQLTYDILAEVILQVCHEYDIQKKVVGMVTDSASYIYKSCNVFGRIEDSEWEDDDSDGVDEEAVEIEPILEEERNEFLSLPPHYRCVSHSLNLLVMDDAQKAEYSAVYRNQKKATFLKCQAFWRKQRRSIHAADMIKAIIGSYLEVPNISQWYSVYLAMETLADVMQNKCDSLNVVCDYLEVSRFQQSDVNFVKEYTMVMQPIAKAMDTLKQDTDMHMGYLLPTLTWLRRRLQAVERENMQYCRVLITACLNGMEMRFGDMMHDRSFLMAALTHPKFKLRWLENKDQRENALLMLKQEFRQRSSDNSLAWSGAMKQEDVEFLFEHEDFDHSVCDEEMEVFMSNTVKEVQCLHSLPTLKDLFIMYNTSLPTSVSVKRLFTAPGDIQIRKQSSMYDKEFENLLIFKFNMSSS